MKVVIIGGVAAGASTAARLRRLDETAEILILERGSQVSYANCGLPYYVGGVIEEEEDLLLQTPESLWARFRIQVRIHTEVTRIFPQDRWVEVRDRKTGQVYREPYDKLVLTPGGEAVLPPIPGRELPCVRTVRTVEDAVWLRQQAVQSCTGGRAGRAAVVGGGFIGLEMAENLREAGLEVLLLEGADQIFPPFDREMAAILQTELEGQGISVRLESPILRVEPEGDAWAVVFGQEERWPCDLVVMAIGVRPESRLAREAGLEVNSRGGIVVDENMRTSDPDIYAAGDAVEVFHWVSGQRTLLPLAGPANRQGRIIAAQLAGLREETFSGVVGSSVVKVFGLTAACAGVNEKALKAAGVAYQKIYLSPQHHAGYYPGGEPLTMKLLFAPDGRILGIQCVGKEGVEKRVDVTAALLQGGGTVSRLAKLELCYAPPYSSAKDPLNYAGFIAENVLAGRSPVRYWEELKDGIPESVVVLDVRTPEEYAAGHLPGSRNIPVDELRERLEEIPQDREIWIYCQVGLRGYVAQRILMQRRPEQPVYNLSGGWRLRQAAGSVLA